MIEVANSLIEYVLDGLIGEWLEGEADKEWAAVSFVLVVIAALSIAILRLGFLVEWRAIPLVFIPSGIAAFISLASWTFKHL